MRPSLLLLAFPSGCGAGLHAGRRDGPESPADQPKWLESQMEDRTRMQSRIRFNGGLFDEPELRWTQSSYIQTQMHPYDRFFYDEITGNFTVGRFLSDLKARYGGVDALLLWPTYTNIGIDDRNQFDFFRAVPGGLDGLRTVVRRLKQAGVRVLLPYNPWDSGTNREKQDDEHAMAILLKLTEADGMNGDTMKFMPRSFWAAALDHRHPIALEAEQATLSKKHDDLNWATMGWGYWDLGRVPSLDFNKFVYANQRLEHQGSECTAHAFGGRIGTGPTANT